MVLPLLLFAACNAPDTGKHGSAADEGADSAAGADTAPLGSFAPDTLDLDGDGFADLVIGAPGVNDEAGRVYLFDGTAAGLPATPTASFDGVGPGARLGSRVTIAPDGDGDGLPDLLVTDATGVALYGGGGIYAQVDTHGWATGLVGRTGPLLAVSDEDGIAIWPLAGPSGAPLATIAGTDATSDVQLTAGDLDGDGYDELVYVLADAVHVVHGPVEDNVPVAIPGTSGSGLIGPPRIIDLHGDGAKELLVGSGTTDLYDGLVTVWDPLGSATVHPAALATTLRGPVAVADFDGDGRLDAALGHPDRGGIDLVDLETGAEEVALPDPEGSGAVDDDGDALTVADFDADGLPDLLVGRPYDVSGGAVDVWRADDFAAGVPSMSLTAPDPAGTFRDPEVAGLGDINGDGHADFVTSNDTQVLAWYGHWAGPPDALLMGGSSARIGEHVAAAGDVNGDGYRDLLTGDLDTGDLALYEGGPDGFGAAAWTRDAPGSGRILTGLGDVNGDGYADVGTWNECACEYPRFQLYVGAADGLSAVATSQINAERGDAAAGADLDGDGYAEIVVGDGDSVWVWHGTATGPEAETGDRYDAVGGRTLALPGDFDGDGSADVLTAGLAVGGAFTVNILHLPASTPITTFAVPGLDGEAPVITSVGDLDGDAMPDLVVGSATCDVGAQVYVVWGGLRHSEPVAVPLPDGAFGMCAPVGVGDLAGDGAPRVVVQAILGDAMTTRALYVLRPGLDPTAGTASRLSPYGNMNAGFGSALR